MGLISTVKNRIPWLVQIVKFSLVGVVNTLVDLAVLNLLVYLTKITEGPWIAVFNLISFTAAVINSYLMNKYWTFQKKRTDQVTLEASKFVIVSIIGAGISSGILYFWTTYLEPILGFSAEIWVNVGKILAIIVVMVWNFLGYKFWAFKNGGQTDA